MTPKQAEQLLKGYLALLEDESLQSYQGYTRQEYFDFLAFLFGTTNRIEITTRLERIRDGKEQARSLPLEMESLMRAWLEAQKEDLERQTRAAAKVASYIKQQKELLRKTTFVQAVRERHQDQPKEEPVETTLRRIDLSLENKIGTRLSEHDSILAQDPVQNANVSNQIKDVLIALALQSEKEESEAVLPAKEKPLPLAIEEILRNNGIRLSSEQKIELFQEIANDTKPEAETLKKLADNPIPETVLTAYALKTEPVAISPLYAILHPQVALANLEKTALAPVVTFLNLGEPENLTQDQKEALNETRKGVTPEMINHTIENLKASGLPEDHPTIKKLEAHREKLDRFQTNEEGKKTPLTKIYETYHKAANMTNGSKIVDKQTGVALSGKPVWANKNSYSFNLKQFINNAGQKTGLVQKINVLPGKIGFKFAVSTRSVATSIYRNTAGRVLSGVKSRVAKSAVGASVKKAASWTIGKLGVKAAISTATTAIGAAIGGPVGAFVGKALGILADKLLKPLASWVSRQLKNPNSAVMLIAGGLGLAFLVPKLAPLGFGVAAVVAVANAPLLVGAAASGISGFLSALSGMVVSVAVTALTVGVLAGLTVLTVFIVVVSSGAFILPVNPLNLYGGSHGLPPTIINPKCANLLDLVNNAASSQCVPPAMLMATSRVEAGGIWGLDCALLGKFTTDRWWENATPEEINKGYCYDTCAASGLCSGTTVMGPMQFEEQTWFGWMPGYTAMDRCRLDLSLEAAAKKIKNNSGTGPGDCTSWSEQAVRQAAFRYCGSCGTLGCLNNLGVNDSCSPACGTDYCGMIWTLYQQYAGI